MDPLGTHDGSHGDECFGCRIKSVQFSNACTPTRTPSKARPAGTQHNNWEKGVLRDERGMPVYRNGQVIGLKEYAQDKRKIDAQLRAAKQGLA